VGGGGGGGGNKFIWELTLTRQPNGLGKNPA
jgi:hypothetical protein